jgi:hypothetical protein
MMVDLLRRFGTAGQSQCDAQQYQHHEFHEQLSNPLERPRLKTVTLFFHAKDKQSIAPPAIRLVRGIISQHRPQIDYAVTLGIVPTKLTIGLLIVFPGRFDSDGTFKRRGAARNPCQQQQQKKTSQHPHRYQTSRFHALQRSALYHPEIWAS